MGESFGNVGFLGCGGSDKVGWCLKFTGAGGMMQV